MSPERVRARPPRRVEAPLRRAWRKVGIAVAVVVLALPMAPLVLTAFTDVWRYPAIVPQQWGWSGWERAWGGGAGDALLTSVAIGVLVAAFATPLGVLAGYALAFHRRRWTLGMVVLLALPLALPPYAVTMGLTATTLALQIPFVMAIAVVLTVFALPYTTLVMRSGYLAYEREFEDAARTLGASRRMVLTRVHLPHMAPSFAAATFLAFLVAWSDYIVTLLIGGGAIFTLPQALAASQSGSGNASTTAVLALVMTALPALLLVISVAIQRKGSLT